jgi:hypothetical protein
MGIDPSMAPRRLGTTFYALLLSALAITVIVAFASSSINLSQNEYILEESGGDERATENSFFDSLAAKDAAKSNDVEKNSKVKNGKNGKESMGARSIRGQFARAQQQLEKAKAKMHQMEEKDRVQAEKQTIKMERNSAHDQAIEYERHLRQLSDSVFPSSASSMDDPADAVRDALVDDIHSSSKSAISSLKAKARRTISHAQGVHHAAPAKPANKAPVTKPASAAKVASPSIMDTVQQAGEALAKGASDALFSHPAAPSAKAARAAKATPAAKAAKPAAATKHEARRGAAKHAAAGKR